MNEAHRAASAAFRLESPKIIAALVRIVRDIDLAEELAQDALVAALEQWPESGVPHNPGAWLMAAAKNHAVNALRRASMLDRKHAEIGRAEAANADRIDDEAVDDDIGNDLLRLVFVACHPILSIEARVALTLRLLGGLGTGEIARAFLAPEPTIQQRIVRAKRAIAEAHVPFEVPRGDERDARVGAVLAVVYLIFNEGHSATAGEDLMRIELCEDALRLARVLASLMPDEPEVSGLLALLELTASRAAARTDAKGDPILLLDQNRALWDRVQIERGLTALARAEEHGARGPYTIQAAIAACHARARAASATDWSRIASLYASLEAIAPSPVVALNRAMAVSMADGPERGLAMLDAIPKDALASYHFFPSARAELLEKLGRMSDARAEFERAASMTKNERQRTRLLERAKKCRD